MPFCVLAVLLTTLVLPVSAADTGANAIFLVAGRNLQDPRFRESVVLVTQPRDSGPWGVIVNKPLDYRLADVFTDHSQLQKDKGVVFFGGPVQPDGLVFLARGAESPRNSVAVLKDVFFTGDADWIDSRLRQPGALRNLRVYAGYSGWAPGQLQNEMQRGDWHIVPADAATVFDKDPSKVWPELIERAANKPTRDEGGRMKDEWFLASAQWGSSFIPHPSSFVPPTLESATRAGGDRP